jgi:hypothetical protein
LIFRAVPPSFNSRFYVSVPANDSWLTATLACSAPGYLAHIFLSILHCLARWHTWLRNLLKEPLERGNRAPAAAVSGHSAPAGANDHIQRRKR